jgi:hypothetical protein
MLATLVPAPTVTIEEVLEVLERDRARHMTTDRATERDLAVLEEALGRRLPEQFQAFLARLGGGIFYERHELFGARRLMVHDIELVPDLLSFRRGYAAGAGIDLAPHLLPFHRAEEGVHLLDLGGTGEASVVSAAGARAYPDFARFLQSVVIPEAHGPRS